jgi:hypothetical protein
VIQPGLSFEQAPPLAVPFRFFLLAPCFLLASGLLMLALGPAALASRWAPETLALTHLVTLGFVAQTMIGAVLQVLPVVAGSPVIHPGGVAFTTLLGLNGGTLLLVFGFLAASPPALQAAAAFLALGLGAVVLAAGVAMVRGKAAASPTVYGLRLAFLGLAVTVALGVLLALALAQGLALPLQKVVSAHVSWGFFGWVLALVAAVAYQVVPMFQMTPQYPQSLSRWLLPALFLGLSLRTVTEWFSSSETLLHLLDGLLGLLVLGFGATTLRLQQQRRRRLRDATLMFWQLGMAALVLAAALWLGALLMAPLADDPRLPLLLGVLVLGGFALSVINGMLYKIVPFLVWFHLQARGPGKSPLKSMKDVLTDRMAQGQFYTHAAAVLLLLGAVLAPAWCFYPAALLTTLSAAWLARNLIAAIGVYRRALPALRAGA